MEGDEPAPPEDMQGDKEQHHDQHYHQHQYDDGAYVGGHDDQSGGGAAAAAAAAANVTHGQQQQEQASAEAAAPANPKLQQYESRLSAPDAVMEPNVLRDIIEYVGYGVPPEHVVGMLSNNYQGYAQMAGLVCHWLAITQEGEGPQAGAGGGHGEGRGSADAEEGGGAAALSGHGGGGGGSGANGGDAGPSGGPPPDEATFLRAFVRERFDPDAFHGVFSKGPPKWLDGIIHSAPGRQMLYALSSQHKNCLLLNFAIQKMLHMGHEDEVASVGSSLAGYFGVFHRLLVTRLREVAACKDPRQMDRLTAELKDSVCHAMHTYMHAQMMLTELSSHPNGARFRRLSQELASYAAQKQGDVVWTMHRAFMTSGDREQDREAARLVSSVLARGHVSGGDQVGQLSRLYALPDPPRLALLRQPWLLDLLTQALFCPAGSKAAPADVRSSYIQLLSVAASAVDERDNGGGLDLSDVAPCSAAVRQAVEFAQDALAGHKIRPEQQRAVEEALRTPCAAMGLLHCIGSHLSSGDFWRESYNVGVVPLFLGVLAAMVPIHRQLHDKVILLVSRALHVMGNSKPELARGLLDVAILALQHGRTAEVMAFVEEWAQASDPSLSRYFIFKLLAVTAPPYSAQFAACMIRLMVATGVKRSRAVAAAGRGGDAGRLAQLEEFAAACNEIEFQPPLNAREQTFLQELQMERVPWS